MNLKTILRKTLAVFSLCGILLTSGFNVVLAETLDAVVTTQTSETISSEEPGTMSDESILNDSSDEETSPAIDEAASVTDIDSSTTEPELTATVEDTTAPTTTTIEETLNADIDSTSTGTSESPSTEQATTPFVSTTPVLTTDKDDYHPGETATIFGNLFQSFQNIVLKIFGSDRTGGNYVESNQLLTTDSFGTFSTTYNLDSTYRPFYEMAASTPEGVLLAEGYFRDSAIGTYDQCSNDLGVGYTSGDTGCRWTNGNIQSNNSLYTEGDSTVQRLWLDGYEPGSTHTVTLQYGTTKQGKHAYDFLTTWDASENWVTVSDRCQGIAGCDTSTESSLPIPSDPNGSGQFETPNRNFIARGGTLDSATVPAIVSGTYAGDSETAITITFTVDSSGPMCFTDKVGNKDVTSCGIALWFGAHIAKSSEWTAFNGTTGAGSISGSPYHVALSKVDGVSVGQRDNQMQAGAIASTIIIRKETGETSPEFSFDGTGSNYSDFTLSGGESNSQFVFQGSYSVTEGILNGWNLSDITCLAPVGNGTSVNIDEINRKINITIGSEGGSVVDCTFVNAADLPIPGQIVVDKVTFPGADLQSFDFNITGPEVNKNFPLTDAATPEVTVALGNGFSVTESPVEGWTTQVSCIGNGGAENPASITVDEEEVVTCTFTNTKLPKLTVTKVVVNDNGGVATVASFPLFVDGGSVTSGVQNTFSIGAHTVSETSLSGYTASFSGDCDAQGAVSLAAGDVKSCTITNDDQAATLIVNKVVVNDNGGTATADDFSFAVNGGSAVSFEADGSNSVTVNAGTYTVTEPAFSGYTTTYDNCSDLVIPNGGTATCTITNNDNVPALTLVKVVTNDNGGGAAATDWTLTATGPTPISGAGGVTSDATFDAGTYALSESAGPAGYTASSWVCVGGTQDGSNITVGVGESATCTITNNDNAPSLTLVKEVVNDNGGTAIATAWTLSADGPTDISGAGGATSDSTFDAGTYALSETGPSGYTAGAWSCVGGTQDGSNITVALGQSATCTIVNNDNAPSLTLNKIVNNNNGGTADEADFTLSATGPTSITGPGAAGSTDVTSDASFDAGTYTLSETGPLGYVGSSWTCSGGSQNGNQITVGLGESATCSITNDDDAPSLTLVKQVINNNGGSASTTAWTLSAAGPTPISGAGGATSGTGFEAGTYTLSETGVTGYTASDWVCVGGTQVGNQITVGLGQDATCTITNDDQQAFVRVVKVVTNDSGGSAAPDDFNLTLEETPVLSGVLTPVNPGTYTAGETLVSGYTFEGFTGDCDSNGDVTVALGETKTCTLTNNDNQSYIIVDKTVINNSGGSAVADDFLLTVDGQPALDGVAVPVNPGVHTAGETNLPGYTAGSWGGACSAGGTVSVALGETKTCTITNDDQQATITVVKTVVNDNGGQAQPNDFNLTLEGNAVSSGVAVPVNPGTYTAGETLLSGYTFSGFSGNCDSNGDVTVALGESKTCTLTNNDVAPVLHLRKIVTNNNGGQATVADFTLTADGDGSNDISGTSPVDSGSGLIADTFALSETGPAGYSASAWSCVGGNQSGSNITVGIGEEATCTITNDDIAPTLTVIKHVINDNGGTTTASAFTMNVTATNPSLASFAGTEAPGTNITLNAGAYSVGETGPSGYSASFSADCTGSIAVGENKTCTITNDDIAPTLTLVKTVVNDNGGNKLVSDFALSIDGNSVISGVVNPVLAGDHTASEVAVAGYAASAWGGDCAANGSVSLLPGQNKTCTITNDDIAPTLTLIKNVVTDDGGNAVVSDFPLFINGNLVTSGVANTLAANTLYTATETTLAGYTPSAWSGDCDANGTITLLPGDNKTCTITNDDQPATIILNKVLIKDNGGIAGVNDFGLTVGGSPVNSGASTLVDANVPVAINEAGLPGYSFVSITGDAKCPAILGGTITPDEGETIECTITNDDIAPSLTLVKEVLNAFGTAAAATSWTLTADGPTPISGAGGVASDATFSAGSYDLSESSGPSGYEASAWSCVKNGGAPAVGASISLALADTATCTIINRAVAPELIVIKHVINDNGGTTTASAFTMNVSGAEVTTPSFPGSEAPGFKVFLDEGAYSVSESGPSGYAASFSADCTGSIAIGETKTCTVTNDDIAPQLTVIKHVVNDNGGLATASDFTMNVTATNPSDDSFSGSEAPGTTIMLDAGNYSVDESAFTGYAKSLSADCAGFIGVGQTKTCTITNDDIAPTLTLVKTVVNDNGGQATAANFQGMIDANNVPWAVSQTLMAGAHTASETNLAGYTAGTWGGDCASDGSITLNPGENKICTITNDDQPGTLIVKKIVINNNGGSSATSSFSFAVNGGSPVSFEADGQNNLTVNAGSYSVVESSAAGYTTTYSNCTNVAIPNGGTATCTITNDDIALPTRTQGFWQTHTQFASNTLGTNNWEIGNKDIDSSNKLFAGFYSSISKKTTGAKRIALDQARMQMLQQWLAAKLNCEAFGCHAGTETLLTNAATAWANNDTALILSYASQIDAYNNSQDALPISANQGKATPKTSQSQAASSLVYFDPLP